jgi:hypothetical protein
VKTVETLPDSSENIIYTNAYGQVLLKVFTDSESEQSWISYYRYNDSGRLVLEASPSAVTGYDDSYPDLLHDDEGDYEYLSNDSGLITVYDYYTTTTAAENSAGGVPGFEPLLNHIACGEVADPIQEVRTIDIVESSFDVRVQHPRTFSMRRTEVMDALDGILC